METLILVEPVVAELGTVNDPETGVVLERALLHTNSPSSSKSPFPFKSIQTAYALDKFVLSKLCNYNCVFSSYGLL
jgi:hypothetical protein